MDSTGSETLENLAEEETQEWKTVTTQIWGMGPVAAAMAGHQESPLAVGLMC